MPPGVKEASLAMPLDMAVASDGTLYVAAFGSSTVGVFSTTELEDGTFVPNAARHIAVSGGGPSGLALDEAHHRLYVLTRFDNAVKVIDTTTGHETGQHALYNPEPADVVAGRRFLYDARHHVEQRRGVVRHLPCLRRLRQPRLGPRQPRRRREAEFNPAWAPGHPVPFHPMKGPMTTQTLRGLVNQGPMHWRGDRTGATFIGDQLVYDTTLAFEAFNVAFDSLLGRDDGPLSDADMKAFTDFALQITPPPNPVRSLDNQLTAAQANGRNLYLDRAAIFDKAANCGGCHTLNASDGHLAPVGQRPSRTNPRSSRFRS